MTNVYGKNGKGNLFSLKLLTNSLLFFLGKKVLGLKAKNGYAEIGRQVPLRTG